MRSPNITLNCNNGTLSPYIPTNQNPWNLSKIKHAYRRMAFGATQAETDTALQLSPGNFINLIVDTAAALSPTPAPPWGFYSFSDFTNYSLENGQYFTQWRKQTLEDFIHDGLHSRLTFFWMNHFVTQQIVYGHSPYVFQYYNVIQTHALGNLRDFVRAIGINSTMLLYLNGFENTNTAPNENFARELYELFTIGQGNGYTQEDIVNTARALTGYNHRNDIGGQVYFDQSTHDTGIKEIFGQTGAWGYDDVVDILFQERGDEVAHFICKKLYKFFVSPEITSDIQLNIINPLVQTFINNDFELVPLLKQLFKSEHFFDENAIGAIIKSPFDNIMNLIRESGFLYNENFSDSLLYHCKLIGQELYNPPDVSGWQRDENWINTATITGRWKQIEAYVNFLYSNNQQQSLVDLAKDLTNNSNDPEYITTVIVDYFMARTLYSPIDYQIATDIFKADVPQNHYDNGIWNLDAASAPYQVSLLLKHLPTIPEFHLK